MPSPSSPPSRARNAPIFQVGGWGPRALHDEPQAQLARRSREWSPVCLGPNPRFFHLVLLWVLVLNFLLASLAVLTKACRFLEAMCVNG